jgi:hypothetical protein
MNRKKRYLDQMEAIRQAHQEFSDVWSSVRSAEIARRGGRGTAELQDSSVPMKTVWAANGVAYRAAQPQSDRRDELLAALIDDLPLEELLEGVPEAIDAVLDFLETDVLAFRCGYVKAWCLRKLKTLHLNRRQQERLRKLTVSMCEWPGQRHEFRELARLMIRVADAPLFQQLCALARQSSSIYTRRKAQRVRDVILNGRPDLRQTVAAGEIAAVDPVFYFTCERCDRLFRSCVKTACPDCGSNDVRALKVD